MSYGEYVTTMYCPKCDRRIVRARSHIEIDAAVSVAGGELTTGDISSPAVLRVEVSAKSLSTRQIQSSLDADSKLVFPIQSPDIKCIVCNTDIEIRRELSSSCDHVFDPGYGNVEYCMFCGGWKCKNEKKPDPSDKIVVKEDK